MVTKLSSKEINENSMSFITPILESYGFENYKAKAFLKIIGNVVHYMQFFPNKNDFHIWYSCYPLFQNDLWFGSGVVADRYPENEGTLKVSDSASLKRGMGLIANRIPDVIKFFDDRSTIEGLANSIPSNAKVFPLLVKGFCLSSLGSNDEAILILTKFIDSGLDLGEAQSGAVKLLDSIYEGNSIELLERNKFDNIKRLRLKKFLKN